MLLRNSADHNFASAFDAVANTDMSWFATTAVSLGFALDRYWYVGYC